MQCSSLGKRYLLGEQDTIFTFAEMLSRRFRSLVGLGAGQPHRTNNEFWAVRDVSFELPRGAVMGLIGRNGSGKSTLLKILSRITPPTTGQFGYNGSIASLLEVGTGFKQELTGIDNIFLSGTTLGLKRRDIQARLDEIIEFAEIGPFIHTPVKRYSSGMYVRLAFAVAAHLEPDILLVDEVLAVGDQKFQRKCLSKMSSVAGEGRTIIFVSHNMQAITQLCSTGLLLHQGKSLAQGQVSDIVRQYQQLNQSEAAKDAIFKYAVNPELKAQILEIKIGPGLQGRLDFDILEPIPFEIHFEVRQDLEDLQVQLAINSLDGMCLMTSRHLDTRNFRENLRISEAPACRGQYLARGWIPAPLLNTGYYELVMYLTTHLEQLHDLKKDLHIEVHDLQASFSSCIKNAQAQGVFVQAIDWEVTKV